MGVCVCVLKCAKILNFYSVVTLPGNNDAVYSLSTYSIQFNV